MVHVDHTWADVLHTDLACRIEPARRLLPSYDSAVRKSGRDVDGDELRLHCTLRQLSQTSLAYL